MYVEKCGWRKAKLIIGKISEEAQGNRWEQE